MNGYRGTPEPELALELRDHPCVFFARHYEEVIGFATAGETAPEGYIQEYSIPDGLRLLDLATDVRIVEEFAGRVLKEHEMRKLLHYPSKKWIRFVKRRGFQGISGDDYVCLFDVSPARLLRRWKLEYDEGQRGYMTYLLDGKSD